jgi:transcriptional regulator GlxA family with amidase domain
MHRIALLVYEGFQILDATGPATVFEMAGRVGAPYALSLVSVPGGLIRSSGGIVVETEVWTGSASADTLIVPGVGDRLDLCGPALDAALLSGIRSSVAEGRRVASVCSGALLLGAAGILDGRRAATHWAVVQELKRRHPRVDVDGDSIYVEDRGVWTSAGVTAGIDLALAMVGRDQGEDVARKAAQLLVVYYRRPGAQSQHSALLDLVTPDNRFASLVAWARTRLAEPLSVERLAEEAHLSVRQFTRAFTEATGVPPAKAIERLRFEAARAAIEAGEESLELVARRSGFGSVERMRRAFLKLVGQPPISVKSAARRSFGVDERQLSPGV